MATMNTTDDLAPLCLDCGGVCVRKERRPSLLTPQAEPVALAVCLRCSKIRGIWAAVMVQCVEEREIDAGREAARAVAGNGRV